MTQTLSLKKADVHALSLLFEAFSNESRLSILNLLREGPRNVGEICEALALEQTVVSHNLRCLTFCGLVTGERFGKTRIYSLNKETVEPILRLGDRHIAGYASNLRRCDSLER
jgi:DNA-binding transcriptional ArsR family regulator